MAKFEPGDIVTADQSAMGPWMHPEWATVRMVVTGFPDHGEACWTRAIDERPDADEIRKASPRAAWDPQDADMFWPRNALAMHTKGPGYYDPAVLDVP